MGLIDELRRRNVFRMAGLYLVGAWLITQVAGTLLPMFEAPAWVARATVIVLAIGFVPALVFAWVFELTADGLKRDSEVAPERSDAPRTAHRMNRAIVAVLLMALVYFGVDKFALAPEREATRIAQASKETAASNAATAPAINHKSIAVLPFTDLSPSHDQEYFSDGMAEELLNALAKVKDLKVAGRTSSFSFKGKNEDLRVIGKTLGVANVLEGSVRKQDDKVRITAQLIQSEDGFHLWSETYDGDLKDVFELQERIARSITDALKVVLVGEQQQRLMPIATGNPEAYALFLKATTIFNRRDGAHFADAIAELEEAIRLDPKYARAYSRLAALYAIAQIYTTLDVDYCVALTERNARAAIAIAPSLGEAYAALGYAYSTKRRYIDARPMLEKAVAIDPSDVTAQFWLGTALIATGYTAHGRAQMDRTLALDPKLPNALSWRGLEYAFAGNLDEARRMLEDAVGLGLSYAEQNLAYVSHAEGNDAKAISGLAIGIRTFLAGFPAGANRILADGIYGTEAQRREAIALIDDYLASRPAPIAGVVPYSLLMLSEPARALSVIMPAPSSNDALMLQPLWSPAGRAARKLQQFPEFVRATGLAELWDKYGPPDACQRKAPGDYICD